MHNADSPLYWRALTLPKRGNPHTENEDAWAADARALRFALADGASESAFAGLWARLVAEGFVSARRPGKLATWLNEARRRWSAEVAGLELPWYGQMKRDEGAFAKLLGLAVRPPAPGRPGRWKAGAIGDTCLVCVRDGRLVRAFPLQQASDFDSQPDLIASRDGPPLRLKRASGSLLPGDRLLLMTDALAHWFLQAAEADARPWEAAAPMLTMPDSGADFAVWMEKLRGTDGLRADDVTLLILAAGSAPEE